MRHQRIIVKLPVEMLSSLDDRAYASRLTREELLLDLCRNAVGGNARHTWISLADAAKRAVRNVGHLRKLCEKDYGPRGLARKVRRGKSRSGWEIREDANPAFAPGSGE